MACEDEKLSSKLPAIQTSDIQLLESYIDEATNVLPPLKEFILPGGSVSSSHLHVARTLARRAERQILHLAESSTLHPLIVPFVNRLSDYLFVMARRVNQLFGQADVKWMKEP